ncbi:hypothetical protein H0H92_006081 [Tricholoma furcatifolium]|nr:hypothetical protein H0H92_006081 [Tricholoma furcatifolium]
MAEQGEANPYLEVCPDFAHDDWQMTREALMVIGMSEEDTITSLGDTWRVQNAKRRVAWDNRQGAGPGDGDGNNRDQVRLDPQRQQAAPPAAPDDQGARAAPPRPDSRHDTETLDLDRKDDGEAKERKMKIVDPNLRIASQLPLKISEYAKRKIEAYQYCELWYFTQEGSAEASREKAPAAEEAFSLSSRIGDELALRPTAAVQASRSAIPDSALTWDQFTYANKKYLAHTIAAGWPKPNTSDLARFFAELETSPYLDRGNGKRIILTYQAEARKHWMDTFRKESKEEPFSVGILNEKLMEGIANRIEAEMNENVRIQVRNRAS